MSFGNDVAAYITIAASLFLGVRWVGAYPPVEDVPSVEVPAGVVTPGEYVSFPISSREIMVGETVQITYTASGPAEAVINQEYVLVEHDTEAQILSLTGLELGEVTLQLVLEADTSITKTLRLYVVEEYSEGVEEVSSLSSEKTAQFQVVPPDAVDWEKDDFLDFYQLIATGESDIEKAKDTELAFIRESIYAMHGYIFEIDVYTAVFSEYSWYKPSISPEDFSLSLFTTEEKTALSLILEEEAKRLTE